MAHSKKPLERQARDLESGLHEALGLGSDSSSLQEVLDSIPAHIAVLDDKANVLMVNSAWRAHGELGPAGLPHGPAGANYLDVCRSRLDEEHTWKAMSGIKKVLEGEEQSFSMEYSCLSGSSGRWFKMFVTPLVGERRGVVVSHMDITDRKEVEEHIQHNAIHDTLTGLPNRALFQDRLGMALNRARRNSQYLFAVLYLDIDRFRLVNDSFGHVAGNAVLMGLANRLVRSMRSVDTLSRFGADEFAILLDDFALPREIEHVASRLLQEICRPYRFKKQDIYITASMGVVLDTETYLDPEQLLRDADNAMSHAKELGGNRVAMFDPSMHDRISRRMQLEIDLRKALNTDQLLLHYQPIVNIKTQQLKGFEALVRWQHPEMGLVAPGDFIPIAEESDLIVTVGDWVLRQACAKAIHLEKTYDLPPDVTMSVNISGKQFTRPEFVDEVRSILKETGMSPARLKLELTESVFMRDAQRAMDTVRQLKELGVQLAIDDFGTGYSSLSYIEQFPVDSLKVDRSFISKMAETKESMEIVRTVIAMAHTLGIEVVAEGIELSEQATLLSTLDCEGGQGFLFSRPLDEAAVEELVRKTLAG